MSDYSSNFPQQRPTLNLDFANSGKLDSRLSYSRSSGGTYMSNEKALSSENLLKNSQDYSSVWANQYIAAPAGSQTAPDGSSTAFKLTATSEASAAPTIYQASLNLAATTHTAIVHLKAGTASHGFISIRTSSGNSAYAMINFSAGTVGNGHYGTVTGSSSTVTALGSDWFKVTLTATTVAATNAFVFIGSSDGTVPTSSGYPMWTTSGQTIFVWGAQLSTVGSKVYDSPTTTQISREYSPLLKTAAADEPRFEYAADGQSVGLLIEAQATNYIPNSEVNTGYSMYRLTASPSACVGPTGALAQVFTETTEDGSRYENNTFTTNLDYSTTYTASVYAKKVASGTTDSRLKLRINGMGGQAYAGFNLVNGTVTQQAGSAVDSAAISAAGNGWYRISMTWTNEAADRPNGIILAFNNNTSSSLASYVGDGFTSYALAGLQVEEGSAPSSLISTSGASASRASDSCSVVDASIFNGGEHSVYWEGSFNGSTNDPRMFSMSDGTTANRFVVDLDDGNVPRIRNWADGTAYMNRYATGQTLPDGFSKIVGTLKTDESRLAINGTQYAVDTTNIVVGTMDRLGIGTGYNNNNIANGHVKRVAYYNTALSQTEIETLTS